MKIMTKVCSVTLTTILLISLFIIPACAGDSKTLDCGVEVKAQYLDEDFKVTITNNSDKAIKMMKYAYFKCDENGEIESTFYCFYFSLSSDGSVNVEPGNSETFSPPGFMLSFNEKIPVQVNLYIYYIEFTDGTTWGADQWNVTDIRNNSVVLYCAHEETPVETKTVTDALNPGLTHEELDEFRDGIAALAILIMPALIIKLIGTIKRRRYSGGPEKFAPVTSKEKGIQLEFDLYVRLNNAKIEHKRILNNIYIPKSDGSTSEIDIMMIHNSGIYVFECKNYSGWIFGKSADKKWTQTLNKRTKNKFLNPVVQNKGHIKALDTHLSHSASSIMPKIPYFSMIVFSDKAEFINLDFEGSDKYTKVLHIKDVLMTLENNILFQPKILTDEQVDEIYEKLFPFTLVSEEIKQKHIEDVKKRQDQ